MYKRVTFGLLLTLTFGSFSCKKCISCEVSDSEGNQISTEEFCGNSQVREDAETRARIKADGIGGSYRCE